MGKTKNRNQTVETTPVEVNWKLDKRGKLTVSCNGRMPDYSGGKNLLPPWYEVKDQIVSVCLEEGVTEVGGSAFEGCRKLKRVTLPWSLRRLHHDCFKNCTSLKQMATVKEAEYRFSGEGFSLKAVNQRAAAEMKAQKTQEIVFGMNTFYAVPWAMEQWGDFYVKKDVLYTCFSNRPDLRIPEGVRSVQSFALMDADVKTLVLPQTLVRLEPFALANTQIEELIIPKGTESIGEYAFADSSVKKILFDNQKSPVIQDGLVSNQALARTIFPERMVRGKYLPEAYKVDLGSNHKIYDMYKKLQIKEKKITHPLHEDVKAVFGVTSLQAENSIYRRIQRGSAIFKVRYDEKQKRVLDVSSWHFDFWGWYTYEAHVAEPYYDEGRLELKSTALWYFSDKKPLKKEFFIGSVLEEWDGEEQIRRRPGNECEEWFWAAGYYGNLRTPEKDLLQRWLKVHPEYTIE